MAKTKASKLFGFKQIGGLDLRQPTDIADRPLKSRILLITSTAEIIGHCRSEVLTMTIDDFIICHSHPSLDFSTICSSSWRI